ncbi:MAG: sugar nucleotide-binding protein [Alistipes sp.]
MKKLKVIILGATGMAGHLITFYFQEQGHDVTAYSRHSFPFVRNIIGDVFEPNHFKAVLLSGNYDLVINCIGILNKMADDNPAEAIYLNSYLPHLIADTLKNKHTKLIQMSTDCVFAGNTGPYTEDALPDGVTFYDRSKALGEVDDIKNLTFRNSVIGPDMNATGIGLFNWFMKQSGCINGYTQAMWTGITTLTLAKAMEQATTENLTGLYNLVNNTNISKYNLLALFNRHFRASKLTITPTDCLKLDKTLICTRKDFAFVVPSYEQQIVEMKEWMCAHKELYPHYFI